MSVFKCKMCGGDLAIEQGSTVAECEYCGSKQTVPVADDEKKLGMFNRANGLLARCEFDKAASMYEAIVAEFPEEAESYWGLILSNYGIEYVDDPATGKKIPTCHRSRFESLMDDPSFETVMTYSDPIARKVYREEAKKIEELRKRIIEVSGKEEPYDIFICYKDTAEDGQRTIDSVLAQDIYEKLTDAGYRVFFSRITLEDKLGQEYEPYIFAALNSAKVMLVFGSDYEYFNAVWVKNEWSRYLKLMEKDKEKRLIPCYKDIDAYDMPKEFAKLQAQDMGKVGADQDLVRAIKKLLNKEEAKPEPVQTVVQQVVQSGGTNLTSQLKRGMQALEDRDWAQASVFFDKALDIDAECAEAFFGKALAEEQCASGNELVNKRLGIPVTETQVLTACARDEDLINKVINENCVPGFLDGQTIMSCGLTYGERTYPSLTSAWKKRIADEKDYWENNRLFNRAMRYAKGDSLKAISGCRSAVESKLNASLNNSIITDEERKAETISRYRDALQQAADRAKSMRAEAEKYRLSIYNNACKLQASAKTVSDYNYLISKQAFGHDGLRGFKDSGERLQQCVKEIERINAEAAAEKEKAAKARKKKTKRVFALILTVIALSVAAFFVVTKYAIPESKYRAAEALLTEGKYDEAYDAFAELGGYKDSEYRARKAIYSKAEALLAQGKRSAAAMCFAMADDYSDARERSFEIWDSIAVKETVSAGYHHTVGLKADGTVVAIGFNGDGRCSVSGWTDIVAVSAGDYHTVGLKSDSTVVAVGDNDFGQCSVSDWTDIVAVSAGSNHTVGLKSDGTVVAVGDNDDGRCNVFDWTDIVAVSAGSNHTVGLKSDGTVVAVGDNDFGQCSVSDWTDIVAVSAGSNHTVGLKSDGTVVAVGNNDFGQCNVFDWTDIVAVSAGSNHTVGLKSDGTVVAVGKNGNGQCSVSDWNGVVRISAGKNHTVALKADGTVVAIGNNNYGQCDVSEWKDIMLPTR